MLWDTAGQEEFDAITKAYYRGMGLAFALINRPFGTFVLKIDRGPPQERRLVSSHSLPLTEIHSKPLKTGRRKLKLKLVKFPWSLYRIK